MDISASLISLLAVRYALILRTIITSLGMVSGIAGESGAQAAFITGSAVVLLMQWSGCVGRPNRCNINVGIWISIASLALTLILVSFQSYVIKLTGSQAVKPTLHYRSDLLLNAAVLLALVLSSKRFCKCRCHLCYFTGRVYSVECLAIGLMRFKRYCDRQLPEEECQQISDICCAVDGVRGIHDLKTRISGRCVLSSYTWN